MGFLLLVLAALLATSAFVYFMHLSERDQRPAKPRRQYHLETSSWREKVLLLSPFPCALAAMIVFSVPPLDQLTPPFLAHIVDQACSYSPPNLWCWKMPRPTPWILVIHAAVYLWFLGISAYLGLSIMTGRIPKPRRYVEGSFPLGLSWAFLGFWLFMVAGGQFMFQGRLGRLFPYFGLLLCTTMLCGALAGWRMIAITLKYRRPQTST